MAKILTHNYSSFEELVFFHWLKECEQADLISNSIYQPESFLLSDKQFISIIKKYKTKVRQEEKEKTIKRVLLSSHHYTADWNFKLNTHLFNTVFHPDTTNIFVDIKGSYTRNGDGRDFIINQKWVYDKYGIYIYKIIPDIFFKETFAPDFIRKHRPGKQKEYIKTKKNRKKYDNMLTIKQFISLQSCNKS